MPAEKQTGEQLMFVAVSPGSAESCRWMSGVFSGAVTNSTLFLP